MESAHHFSSEPDCNSTAEVPSFSVPLFQLFHACRNGVVLMYKDSKTTLHKLCQTPRSCSYKRLSAWLSARETFVNSLLFPEKILFYKDTIIEKPNPAPRLHTGDCFEIHILHKELCDLLLSSHQNFLLEVLDYQCVFCKEPLQGAVVVLILLQISHKWEITQNVFKCAVHNG